MTLYLDKEGKKSDYRGVYHKFGNIEFIPLIFLFDCTHVIKHPTHVTQFYILSI